MSDVPPPHRAGFRPRAATARSLVLVAALVVLLGAVAMTSGMARPSQGVSRGLLVPPQALLAWGLSAAVVAGLLFTVLGPFWTGREKWIALVMVLLVLFGFAILAERSAVQQRQAQQQELTTPAPQPQATPTPPPAPESPPPAARRPATPPAVRPATFSPAAIAAIGGAALLLALGVLTLGARRRSAAMPHAAAAAALGEAVEASLADIAAETDPRRAVVDAWMAMGDALARHGLGRHAWETPLEYLRRALHAVRVSAQSAQRLTALFQRARYSDHPATEAMRAEALEALRAVRDDLDASGEPASSSHV